MIPLRRNKINRNFIILSCTLLSILLLFPLSTVAKTKDTQRPYVINGKRYYPIPSAVGFSERGIASWYGKKFHGRMTSNGERYDMHAMTAAHKTLPMHTTLLVTNLENGRRTVVRVNDRGPFVQGRIIDLSYRAAKEIGMVSAGVARVQIQAISKEKLYFGKDDKTNYPDLKQGNFYVQIGAFKNRNNALRLEKRFKNAGHLTAIQAHDGDKGLIYRVHIFAGYTLHKAKVFEKAILRNGYRGAFIIAH